eukprot:6213365-Pleurochrysis_carterae.AAC.5
MAKASLKTAKRAGDPAAVNEEEEEQLPDEAAARKALKAATRKRAGRSAPVEVSSGREKKVKSARQKAAEGAEREGSEAALEVSGDSKIRMGKNVSRADEDLAKTPKGMKKQAKEKEHGKKHGQPENDAKSGTTAEGYAVESEEEVTKKPAKERIPCTCFVGQLPYQASAHDIEEHFKSAGAAPSYVRLLTNKQGGGSRGMAFVEFSNESDVRRSPRGHHCLLCFSFPRLSHF